ncbi:ganglioside-induced differentiation-associated protein 1-like 1 isoform X5 [Rhineura floridana]|uniref:ganglioside-induced differentiation-associated protein 1-like 1 isoform X5 n=1 Tax=Rhineura floridana TaxID=261503 RepID=UPI002AC7F122|nr:ganglioside-induced differentiation-associated protein 1-like 1 isoform X5 [Rhineura floridana]
METTSSVTTMKSLITWRRISQELFVMLGFQKWAIPLSTISCVCLAKVATCALSGHASPKKRSKEDNEHVTQLIPEAGSLLHSRVMQYRELLDSLPMDAYTHGCILHPELTMDSMIPKYATAEIRRHLVNASTDLMKLDHEEEPQLTEPYLSKQKKLMAKILEHDNVNYLKKILGELGMVLDQIEAELEKRKIEYQGQKCELWLCGCMFTLADILLGATLHRLKFLGLSKKYWEDGSRPNLQNFFERIQKRFAFRKVLGDIHTTLLSAVVPNAFRLVKRKPPSFFGASFLMGSLGGMGYFAYWYLKKKYI